MDLFAKAVKSGIAKGYAIGKQELQQHLVKQRESGSQSNYDNTSSDYGAQHTAPYPVSHTLSKSNRKKKQLAKFRLYLSRISHSSRNNSNRHTLQCTAENRRPYLPDSISHLSRSSRIMLHNVYRKIYLQFMNALLQHGQNTHIAPSCRHHRHRTYR